jgi:hypothetical protein
MSGIGRDGKLTKTRLPMKRAFNLPATAADLKHRCLKPGAEAGLLSFPVVCPFDVGEKGKKAADQQIPSHVDEKARSHRSGKRGR